MKLRKAVEKAKQLQEGVEPSPVFDKGEPEGNTGAVDWRAPKYSQSKAAILNANWVCDHRGVGLVQDAPELDAYKVLRTQIQQRCVKKGWRTIMITSAVPGEGKTLTAINLAFTFAKAFNQTVLLIDGNLKNQTVHKYLGLPGDVGIIDYLTDDRQLKDLMIWPGVDKMTVISGGKAVHDSSELLGSPKMQALVVELKQRYADRYVVFDVPAVLGGAETMTFAPLVDGIVMVAEANKTALSQIKRALEMLPAEKLLGFVLNKQKP